MYVYIQGELDQLQAKLEAQAAEREDVLQRELAAALESAQVLNTAFIAPS